jgi:hypothetical protein
LFTYILAVSKCSRVLRRHKKLTMLTGCRQYSCLRHLNLKPKAQIKNLESTDNISSNKDIFYGNRYCSNPSLKGARHFSAVDNSEEDEEVDAIVEGKWDIVYEGLMAGPLKRIKTVSITTCTLSMVTMPLLVLYGNQDVALTGRLAVAFTAGIFGVGTTAIVHFIGKTYVGKLWKKIEIYKDEDGYEIDVELEDDEEEEDDMQLKVETYNLFGQKKETEFLLSDVEEGDPRPFSSFKVHGLNFFLHHERDAWYEGDEGRIEELFTRPIETVDDDMEEEIIEEDVEQRNVKR